MNQVIAIAFGGAFGAVFRFLVSSATYQWLGKGFPYGTLAVNLMGSFLIGLMTEALILNRVILSQEYKVAILVGLFGSLTTFSTFSLDTVYLLEQGQIGKAANNIFASVLFCLFAVWLGLSLGRILFGGPSSYVMQGLNWTIPYALLCINFVGAFLIGLVITLLSGKTGFTSETNSILVFIIVSLFLSFSSLYLLLDFFERGHKLNLEFNTFSFTIASNFLLCGCSLWTGYYIACLIRKTMS